MLLKRRHLVIHLTLRWEQKRQKQCPLLQDSPDKWCPHYPESALPSPISLLATTQPRLHHRGLHKCSLFFTPLSCHATLRSTNMRWVWPWGPSSFLPCSAHSTPDCMMTKLPREASVLDSTDPARCSVHVRECTCVHMQVGQHWKH